MNPQETTEQDSYTNPYDLTEQEALELNDEWLNNARQPNGQ